MIRMAGKQVEPRRSDLLYPFYLDEDMSMAFAATIAGGVALESEDVERQEDATQAVRSLRGSLRLFGAGSASAGADRTNSAGQSVESTMVRRHSTHSIFIDLHDELIASGRLVPEPQIEDMRVGDLVSMQLGPAVAPLRRVIDQVLRLLDVMAPVIGISFDDETDSASRQVRRQRARDAAKSVEDSSDIDALKALRTLFIALRDDLDRSGMIDVVVTPEEGASGGVGVLLTLDKRFADETALELLHTSSFTVVGKVTQVWPTDEDVVLLQRRSSLSLLPALSQQVSVGVFSFLIAMAKSIGVVDVEQQVNDALSGQSSGESDEPADGQASDLAGKTADREATSDGDGDAVEDDDVRVGNDIVALHPVLSGPAVQILPLALCV